MHISNMDKIMDLFIFINNLSSTILTHTKYWFTKPNEFHTSLVVDDSTKITLSIVRFLDIARYIFVNLP